MRMKFATISAEKVFPVAGVFDDVVVSKRGALTMGWEINLPQAYSLSEKEYDAIMDSIYGAIKGLPAYTIIHRQDMFLYHEYEPEEAKSFLGTCYQEKYAGRKYMEHHSYLFLTFATRRMIEKGGKASGLYGIRGSVDVPSDKEFRDFRARCAEFITVMTSGSVMSASRLHRDDWLGNERSVGIIQRYMMLGNGSPVMSDIALAPDAVSAYDKSAQCYVIGETDSLPNIIPSVTKISDLSGPSNQIFLSYGSQLGCQLECDHVVNHYLVVPVQDEILHALSKEHKAMQGWGKANDNRLNAEEIGAFLDDAYALGLFTVKAHHNVIAWGTPEQTQEISGKISSALTAMGISSVYNKYNTPVVWYGGIPSNAFDLGQENLMKMEMHSVLCLGMLETFEKGIPGGNFWMCDRMRHVPLRLDIHEAAQKAGLIGNMNTFILGGSGSGKSFFTNHLVRNCYDDGYDIFIIDVGDSYEGQTAVVNEESQGRDGIYMSWDEEHPLTFDAFDGYESWLTDSGGLKMDEDGSNFFLTLIQAIWTPAGGWTDERRSIITQIILDFLVYTKDTGRTKPIFEDFYSFVDEKITPKVSYVSPWETAHVEAGDTAAAERLHRDKEEDYRRNGYWAGNVRVSPQRLDAGSLTLSLHDYALGGPHESLFNDRNPKNLFNSRMNVIEVDKLSQQDQKFYSVCILAIMNAFDIKMRRSQGKKIIIIEEAWKAISNETMAPYLRGLWKTARKFNTSATVVTQEVDDIISNENIKTAILDNSDVKILLDQSNHLNSFGKIQQICSLTPKDANAILSMNRANDRRYGKYKEVFISLGGKFSGVYATEVSKEEALIYESNKEAKKPLLDLWKKIGSIRRAARILAGHAKGEDSNEIAA